MTAAEVDDSLNAASQVLLPFSSTPAKIRVTEIAVDAKKNATVKWSRGFKTTRYAPGTAIIVPTAMQQPNTYYLLAEVTYAYTPPSSFGAIGAMTLGDSIYMVPRNTDQINCPDCQ